jgi:hypothetical protein
MCVEADSFHEPLYINACAETVAESVKIIKAEYLRLAAALIGCDYDSLYQRHKRAKKRRILAGVGIVVVISAILGIAIGVVMIFYQGVLLTVLAAVFLIALPLLRILLAHDRMATLRSEILRIILGIVLIAFLPALVGTMDLIVKIILTVIGVIIILAALINAWNGYRLWKKCTQTNPGQANAVFVDSTGDGVVDTILVDTTGDGKVDTEIKYRHSEKDQKK